ncbi:alpha/beta hydrolase-fold protein [Microbacterium sp. 1P10UB]|uniref:alpha/beta hydrolase n=1 Tax=unclassified Microbacterium TaxID=2609290 RepID=UPI0039A20DCF
MTYWILGLELIDGPVLPAWGILTALCTVLVALVRSRHPWRLLIGTLIGAAVAVGTVVVFDEQRTFGIVIPPEAGVWAAIGLGGAGLGVAGALGRPKRRLIPAVLLILTSLVLCALGVNRAFDITHNLAALIGVQAVGAIDLPPQTDTAVPAQPLSETWTAPAGMPEKGLVGALTGDDRIPSPGFAARDAAIYLPPAALVADPPALPVIVFMMGQPGAPDPTSLSRALDAFAAQHDGLAPIAIIADQLTGPTVDPACHDSETYGAVETYFTTHIPEWIRTHLNVPDDAAYRVIGGYSNGGSCAALWGASHPDVWGSILDVSGNEFPGSETVQATTARVFGGDSDAFEAAKPANVLARNAGSYEGHTAVFTLGADDDVFGPGQRSNAAAAEAAGFTVRVIEIPAAGHVGPALDTGLAEGVAALAVPLGLSD